MQSKKTISSDRAGNRQGNNTAHEDYGHHITQDFHHDDCHGLIVASLSTRSRKFQATPPPEVFAKSHQIAFTPPTIVLDRILRQLPPPCLRGQPALTYSESILILPPTPPGSPPRSQRLTFPTLPGARLIELPAAISTVSDLGFRGLGAAKSFVGFERLQRTETFSRNAVLDMGSN